MQSPIYTGLTEEEVLARQKKGLTNRIEQKSAHSYGQIVRTNVCTLFNLVNLILGIAVLWVGAYRNALFLGVVICNLAIGIIQEIRAKRAVDRLSLVIREPVSCIRDGQSVLVDRDDLVLDDVIRLSAGAQIPCDCVILNGQCDVDESALTGESDTETRMAGDSLLAGSILFSGSVYARCSKVGQETYLSQLSSQARKFTVARSQIMDTLKKLIRILSVVIFPLGILLFYTQYRLGSATLESSVVSTAAALIGMIPEGLMLLTSTVLAVGVVKLGRKNVLIQELYCIEALARVDTLCVDKTGTLTQGNLKAAGTRPLKSSLPAPLDEMLAAFSRASKDRNATMEAIREQWGDLPSSLECTDTLAFDSARKMSACSFSGFGSLLLGAPEFLLSHPSEEVRSAIAEEQQLHRVLLLCHSPEESCWKTESETEEKDPVPLVLILMDDTVRPQAKKTLAYFYDQGVDVRIISGDSLKTVQLVARQVGFRNWESGIDVSTLSSEEEVRSAALEYSVFARVTPKQKQLLLSALQAQGHTVAMTGDGVNDIMALKQADCSIAMASGSEATRSIAHLVLMDSNFDGMPQVVQEGRRSINNIQRSASLFLVKTIFSTLLAFVFLFLALPYPFAPIQLTLISALGIGAPSLVLGLSPNRERVRGRFVKNILLRAMPAGIGIMLGLLLLMLFTHLRGMPSEEVSTVCMFYTAVMVFLNLFIVCLPLHKVRLAMQVLLWILFALAVLLFPSLFMLVPVGFADILLTLVPALILGAGCFFLVRRLLQRHLKDTGEETGK